MQEAKGGMRSYRVSHRKVWINIPYDSLSYFSKNYLIYFSCNKAIFSEKPIKGAIDLGFLGNCHSEVVSSILTQGNTFFASKYP